MSTLNSFLGGDDGRRARRRFPIQQEVRYQCIRGSRITMVGLGKTLEIGSREIRFTTQHALQKRSENASLWGRLQAMLDNTCRMKLEISVGSSRAMRMRQR